MDHIEEVTPEYARAKIANCIDNMIKITEYTKEYYASQADQLIQFGRGLDDLCVEAGIGSLASQIQSNLGAKMEEQMKTALSSYVENFDRELEFFKLHCHFKVDLKEDFLDLVEPFTLSAVADIWNSFPNRVKENSEHRLAEKEEIKAKFESYLTTFKGWMESTQKVDETSIANVLQELDLEHFQNDGDIEFLPEYASETIDKAVSDMEKISHLTKDHFTSIANQQVQFTRDYDDLCINAGIPTKAVEILCDLEKVMSEKMRLLLCQCSVYFSNEVDYIQSRCNVVVGATDLKEGFTSRIEPFVIPTLEDTWDPVLRKIAEHMRYKMEEKENIETQHNEHKGVFEKWIHKLKSKSKTRKTTDSSELNEADQKFIDKLLQEERTKERLDEMEKASNNRLKLYRDFIGTAAQNSLQLYRDTCQELLNKCVEFRIHDSSLLLEELTKGIVDSFKSFELCMFVILEKHCARNNLVLLLAGSDNWRLRFRLSTQQLSPVVEEMFSVLRKVLSFNIDLYRSYRKEERDSIDREFKLIMIADENALSRAIEDKYPTIDISAYPKTLIGQGGQASVFSCDLPGRFFGQPVDKTVVCKKFEHSDEARGCDEIKTLLKLSHPNVVKFMGRGIENNERYLLMEYCPRSLADEINICRQSGSFLSASNFVAWATELAQALIFLQSNGHFHGDLKPDNMLISSDNVLKLADFGSSPPVNTYSMEMLRRMAFNKGTPRYMAPEQHTGEEMDFADRMKCDVWAYGICLWEMITCQTPFGELSEPELIRYIGKDKRHPPIPSVSECESLGNMLRKCWSPHVSDRVPMWVIAQKELDMVEAEIEEGLKEDPEGYWQIECARWAFM